MTCYALNPVLLYTTGCLRTVCIHCRIEFRLTRLTGNRGGQQLAPPFSSPARSPSSSSRLNV